MAIAAVTYRGHNFARIDSEGSVVGRTHLTWLTGPLFGWRDVSVGDVALAVALSVLAVDMTSGLAADPVPGSGLAAALVVLSMTVPVVIARRTPVAASAALAVGAASNWAIVGSMVRCGSTLPAVFFVAFTIGSRCPWRRAVLGMLFVGASLVCQALSDPDLGGMTVPVFMVPAAVGFLVAGRILHARNVAVATLRDRTVELRTQRDRTARLAVESDRARIAADLGDFLHDQVANMALTAAAGRAELAGRLDHAARAFLSIEETGRATLAHMRHVVGDLRQTIDAEPLPVLAQLDRLLAKATCSPTRVEVTGDPQLLPPGIELSGYRIVEHLLVGLEDEAAGDVNLVVSFGPDALELRVIGPGRRRGATGSALAAARERATLHGGTLRTHTYGDRRETVVILPLLAHA